MRRRAGKTRRLASGTTTAAVAVVVAGATGGIVIARRRGTRQDPSPSGRTPVVEADQRYTCACGATYGVTGAGRHRVFWPADGDPADAILEDHCPACERPWPAEEPLTVA
jgi:hypothetical protein